MAIIGCNETPGPCGKFSDAVAEYFVEMAIPWGNGTFSGVCWSNARAYSWTLSPFYIGVRTTLRLWYNNNGHLIATLSGLTSTVLDQAGSLDHRQNLIICAGYFGLAMAVTLSPNRPGDWSGEWNKCLGGWVSGIRHCAGSNCYAGCTSYPTAVWNSFGGAFSPNTGTPTRNNGDVSWDLGTISDPDNTNVYVYGRGTTDANNCGGTVFDQYTQAIIGRSYPCPPLNICPPSIDKVEMTRDICESTVSATLTISIPELGTSGVDLIVGWVAANSQDEALSHQYWQSHIIRNVSENSTIEVPLPTNLIPEVTYYFRAHLTNGIASSDVVLSCDNKALYMPNPTCSVPLLTTEECEILAGGDCLDELTEEDEEVCCG